MTYPEMVAAGRVTVTRKLLILPNGGSSWIDVSAWVASWGAFTEELDTEKLFHINPPKITIQLRNDGQKFSEESVPGSIFYGCPSRVGSWVRIQLAFGDNDLEDIFRGKVARNISLSNDGLVSLTAVGLGEELKTMTIGGFGSYRHLIELEEVTAIQGVDEYTYAVGADGKDVLIFTGWPEEDSFELSGWRMVADPPMPYEFGPISVDFKKTPYYMINFDGDAMTQVTFSNPSNGTAHHVRLFKARSKNRVTDIDKFYEEVHLPAFLDDLSGRPAAQFGICIPDEEVTAYEEMPFPCDSIIVYEHSFVGSEVDWELTLTYKDVFGEETEITLDDLTEEVETNDFTITPTDYRTPEPPHSCSFDYHSRAWKIITKPFRELKWKVNPKMTDGTPAQPVKVCLPYIDMYCGASYGKVASDVLSEVFDMIADRAPFTPSLNLNLENDILFMLDIEDTKDMADVLEQVAEITNSFIWFDALGNLNAVSRATLGDYAGDIVGASDVALPANVIAFGDYQEEVENLINQVRLTIYGGKEYLANDADSIDVFGLGEHEADYFFMTESNAATVAASILAWKASPERFMEAQILLNPWLMLLDLVDLYTRDNQNATYNAYWERLVIIKRTVDLKEFSSTLTIKKLAGFRLLNDLVMRMEDK